MGKRGRKVYKGTPPICQNGVAEFRHSSKSRQKGDFYQKRHKKSALRFRKAAKQTPGSKIIYCKG
jgi:hypothetical protein